MNAQSWLAEIEQAFKSRGDEISYDDRKHLLLEQSKQLTEKQKELCGKTHDNLFMHFFKKCEKKETFGEIQEVVNRFGNTPAENYSLTDSPFLDLANAYWTYKVELMNTNDLPSTSILRMILWRLEADVAALFFPTPGPAMISPIKREKTQREILKKYASSIDIDKFIQDNYILKVDRTRYRSPWDTILAPIVGIGIAAIIVFFWYISQK